LPRSSAAILSTGVSNEKTGGFGAAGASAAAHPARDARLQAIAA
jgi:hypothetical protein